MPPWPSSNGPWADPGRFLSGQMMVLILDGPSKIAIGRLSVPVRFNQFSSKGPFQSMLVGLLAALYF